MKSSILHQALNAAFILVLSIGCSDVLIPEESAREGLNEFEGIDGEEGKDGGQTPEPGMNPGEPPAPTFSLLKDDVFSSSIESKHKFFLTNDYLFFSTEGGEGSFVSTADSTVSKKTEYEYLDSTEIGVRYLDILWVFSGEEVERYTDIVSSGESVSASFTELSGLTFADIVYFDENHILYLTSGKLTHLKKEGDNLSLEAFEFSKAENTVGAGITVSGDLWIASEKLEIKVISSGEADTTVNTVFSIPSLPIDGFVKGVIGADLKSSNLLLDGASGRYLFGGVADKLGSKTVYDWAKVKELSLLYCVRCHVSDGFDNESTWLTTRTSELVTSLTEKSMPPSYSDEGKKIQTSEYQGILAWLESPDGPKEPAPEPEDPEDPVEPEDPKPARTDPIPEPALSVADASCKSCHSTISTYGFWYDKKAAIISDVDTGRMPKNNTLNATEKAALI
ncbi:hypothetical protein N9W79_02495, partial [bacterium]|nr:hypothetical protein [bacterium]